MVENTANIETEIINKIMVMVYKTIFITTLIYYGSLMLNYEVKAKITAAEMEILRGIVGMTKLNKMKRLQLGWNQS